MFMFWKQHNIEKRDLLTPASILLGSILISISICFSLGQLPFVDSRGTNEKVGDTPSQIVKVKSRDDAPKIGKGKVEIIEFSDFECPYCQQFFNTTYKEIKSKYIDTGKVTFIFRHFPLPIHQNATKASEGAECAGRQGKFFEFHDLIFQNLGKGGTGIQISDLKKYAQNIGLDINKFNSCLDNGETLSVVSEDVANGKSAGVTGTPTFFINGQKLVGAQPIAEFEKMIEQALK